MKPLLRILLVLPILLMTSGCWDAIDLGDPFGPAPGDDDDDDDDDGGGYGDVYLFDAPRWTVGGRFSLTSSPPFDIRGVGVDLPADVPVGSSDPSYSPVVPRDEDDINYLGRAAYALYSGQIDAITETYNNGLPSKLGDLVVIPSLAMFTPPDETYRFFQINLQGPILKAIGTYEAGRTQVVGIAFGNGTGGYVPVAPYTNDSFAGALVWMKATKHPTWDTWQMDQRDWRNGSGTQYGSSMRLLFRDNSVVAIIKEAELAALGVTKFRWDVFSYTTSVNTGWSHDFTDWEDLDWD